MNQTKTHINPLFGSYFVTTFGSRSSTAGAASLVTFKGLRPLKGGFSSV